MKDLRKQIDALAEIELQGMKCLSAYTKSMNLSARTGDHATQLKLVEFIEGVRGNLMEAQSELKKKEREIYGDGPVLQIVFERGDSKAKIVVNRPDRKCEEPYITIVQMNAVSAILAGKDTDPIKVQGDIPIAVIGQYGNVLYHVTKCGKVSNSVV